MLKETLCYLKKEKWLKWLLWYLWVSKRFLYNLLEWKHRIRPSKLAYIYKKLWLWVDKFFIDNQSKWYNDKKRSPLWEIVYNKRTNMNLSITVLARKMKVGERTLKRIENYIKPKFNKSTIQEVMDYLQFNSKERQRVIKWHWKYTTKKEQ